MKKIITRIAGIAILLVSCAPQAQPTEAPATDLPSAPTKDADALGDELVHRLSVNLGIDDSGIVVMGVRNVEFGDACLDVPSRETACVQVITPGRVYTLEANGMEYVYHTTEDGDLIQPATLALTWTREGGIAGFCDRLTVFLSGEVYGSNCRSDPNETSGYFARLLTAAQQEQFTTWYLRFGDVDLDISDPKGVADQMIHTLVFHGDGTSKPGRADQQAMFEWAQKLFQKLNS